MVKTGQRSPPSTPAAAPPPYEPKIARRGSDTRRWRAPDVFVMAVPYQKRTFLRHSDNARRGQLPAELAQIEFC